MSHEIRQLKPADYQKYNDFLQSSPAALIHYSTEYKNLLANYLNCEVEYWLCEEEDIITGVLPLMIKEGVHGKVVNSLPYYGSTAGILASTNIARQTLIEKYNTRIAEKNIAAATLIENPFQKQSTEIHHNYLDSRVGQFTYFSNIKNVDDLIAQFDSSARRNIKKAQKSDINVQINNDAMDFLYSTHLENMQKIGGNPKSRAFFATIANYFTPNQHYRIYVAFYQNQPIAALLLFYYKNFIEYFTPVTIEAFREYQPMALILFQAMQDAVTQGYTVWNWGGTWLTQDGVYRFKKKWGAEDIQYQYYTQINNPQLLQLTPQQLLTLYPNFFVLPFTALGR